MSENIASFDAFDTDAQIAAHQAGLVQVILEGQTDVTLFRRYWFPHRQDVFDFVEARTIAAAPGCTGVVEGVAKCAQQGIPAIGIVDRDTLFREKKWDLLFGLDAEALNPDPITDGVYVATRWEVEAYLLEADNRLSDWVSSEHRQPPGPVHLCQNALAIVVKSCDDLLSAASFFAINHEQGQAVNAGMFCDRSADEIQATCKAHLAASIPPENQIAIKVEALVATLRQEQPAENAQRLPFLLQYVDTKRLFKRLVHQLQIRENIWFLATLMMSKGLRPQELDRVLDQVEAQLAT